MQYAYEDLSPDQFELLIVRICQRLLGISVQGFTNGRDGGRDARFEGVAELHPSTAGPWQGKVVIQAKHTNGLNKYFNESEFFSITAKSSTLSLEVPRIKNLRRLGELDHYMLFANRRLSGGADMDIRRHLLNTCGLPSPSIYLCGVEQIEEWLYRFSDIPATLNLDPVDSPLIVSPFDMAAVVEAFARNREEVIGLIETTEILRTSIDEKDRINNVTPDYGKEQRRRFLKESSNIQYFLSMPENAELLVLYQDTTQKFQLKILANQREDQSFDRVIEYLTDLLFHRDPILRRHKRLTRAVVFYMYWMCDIGRTSDVDSLETYAS